MLDHPSIDVMERTKPLSDRGFRLLVALETVMPPGVTQPLALDDRLGAAAEVQRRAPLPRGARISRLDSSTRDGREATR